MSYDIDLNDPITGNVIEFDTPHQLTGGTYAVGGSNRASLNVTYNYSRFYYKVLDEDKGIRIIYGMTGADSIPILEAAISLLGDDVSEDYWEVTEGNAKSALLKLVALAKIRPDGVWMGD